MFLWNLKWSQFRALEAVPKQAKSRSDATVRHSPFAPLLGPLGGPEIVPLWWPQNRSHEARVAQIPTPWQRVVGNWGASPILYSQTLLGSWSGGRGAMKWLLKKLRCYVNAVLEFWFSPTKVWHLRDPCSKPFSMTSGEMLQNVCFFFAIYSRMVSDTLTKSIQTCCRLFLKGCNFSPQILPPE